MLAGEHYIADDPELIADATHAALAAERFNATSADDPDTRRELLGQLLAKVGDGVEVRPPLRVDYGYRTTIGDNAFLNFGVVLLDVAPIGIGADAQLGPNVQLLTPTHPVDPELRRAKWESASPIAIGDNAWLGGGAIVCPGVTVGENTVVGAGAVVSRDLPANAVAVGNPARVVRYL
ncbi:sugar O-acetyltransferase [Haloactinospora alba]|nr:sugar O-acetyltransferase [Haloactinospora alba]